MASLAGAVEPARRSGRGGREQLRGPAGHGTRQTAGTAGECLGQWAAGQYGSMAAGQWESTTDGARWRGGAWAGWSKGRSLFATSVVLVQTNAITNRRRVLARARMLDRRPTSPCRFVCMHLGMHLCIYISTHTYNDPSPAAAFISHFPLPIAHCPHPWTLHIVLARRECSARLRITIDASTCRISPLLLDMSTYSQARHIKRCIAWLHALNPP